MPEPGDKVSVKTAFGTYVEKRAVTGVIAGDSFSVVRVCSETQWQAGLVGDELPSGTPWPAEDVLTAAPA